MQLTAKHIINIYFKTKVIVHSKAQVKCKQADKWTLYLVIISIV